MIAGKEKTKTLDWRRNPLQKGRNYIDQNLYPANVNITDPFKEYFFPKKH